jgi:hypothetical protein
VKITNAHYAHMKWTLAKIPANDVKKHRAFIVRQGKAKDIEMRLRWDLSYQAGLTAWFAHEIYPYANDDHIDTALRKIMRELFGV